MSIADPRQRGKGAFAEGRNNGSAVYCAEWKTSPIPGHTAQYGLRFAQTPSGQPDGVFVYVRIISD